MPTAEQPQTETVLYFFFLRLQWNTEFGQKFHEFHGTLPITRGHSRLQMFENLCEYAKANSEAPQNADITAFSLEPDLIG